MSTHVYTDPELRAAIAAGSSVIAHGWISLASPLAFPGGTLDLTDAILTPGYTRALSLADDPASPMISIAGSIGSVSTTTSAVTPIGSTALTLTSGTGITAGMWLLVDSLNNTTDISGSSGVPGNAWEMVQVGSITGGSVTLVRPTRMYFQNGARVRTVTPVESARIIGGRLFANGGTIANGIVCQYARDVTLEGVSASGFSRAAIEMRLGCDDWKVRDYTRKGENNCDILAVASHGGSIQGFRYDKRGARYHANGIPRGAISLRQRCSTIAAKDLEIGATCIGIQEWGGIDNSFTAVTIDDCDPTERATRCGPGDLDGFQNMGRMGSAYDGGPASVALAEFGYSGRKTGWTIGNMKTPAHANATIVTGFWHDHLDHKLSSFTTGDMGSGNTQVGHFFADFNGTVTDFNCRGLVAPIRVANPSAGMQLNFFGGRIDVAGGSGSAGANTAVFSFDDYVNSTLTGFYVANAGVMFGIGVSYQSINDIRFKNFSYDIAGAVMEFGDAMMMLNGSATNFAQCAYVEQDATGTVEPLVKAATAGAGAPKNLVVMKGTENVASTRMMVATAAPGTRCAVLCTAAAVAQGDSVGHSAGGSGATIAVPVGIEVSGRAWRAKGAGAGILQLV